jgi:hypothetical protein
MDSVKTELSDEAGSLEMSVLELAIEFVFVLMLMLTLVLFSDVLMSSSEVTGVELVAAVSFDAIGVP